MSRPRLAAALSALLLAGACGLTTTEYTRPDLAPPASYAHAAPGPAQPLTDRWWESFGDPALTRAVDSVLTRNNDLAAATLRVRRAQLQAGLAEERLEPTLGASAGADLRRAQGRTTGGYSATGSVAWEVDLWNRLGAQRDAAVWEALATDQDRAATSLSLAGTAAELYWNLGFLNQRLASGEASLDTARRTLELVRVGYRSGAVSGLELNEAEQNVLAQEAAQRQLVQARVETRASLALLNGGQAWPEGEEPAILPPGEPPALAPGLPAELLGRRPDLRAAELRLRSALAGIDAARASFYPTLDLTGTVGGSSSALANVLANPVGTLGAGLALPFLNRDTLSLNLRVSEADHAIAVTGFRQSLLSALADVDNALSARTELVAQAGLQARALAAAREVERIYEVRYRAGAVSLRTWLDAQERRRSAEISLAQTRLDLLVNQVRLYQALGGGTR